jgi:RNA polymerase sigma-70 factor (ECF subfamily)
MSAETTAMGMLLSTAAPAGDADWETLYREQLPRIYNFFRYRVGDGAIAEELTAVTFEKAWLRRQQYRSDLAAFATWMFAIARNVANDHFRRDRQHLPLETAIEIADPHDLEADAMRSFENARLSRLLVQLPDRERELLALKYGSGMNNREIAALTGLSASNVGTILYRTIQSLRSRWKEREENDG